MHYVLLYSCLSFKMRLNCTDAIRKHKSYKCEYNKWHGLDIGKETRKFVDTLQ